MGSEMCIRDRLFMGKPGNMDADDYWMHLYVMISRVRRSAGVLAFDVPA